MKWLYPLNFLHNILEEFINGLYKNGGEYMYMFLYFYKPTTFYIVHYFLETNLPSLNNVAVNIMCIKESGVYAVKKVWNDGESLLHVIKTTVLVVQNKSERRTTHFSTHMCLFLTIFWIKRLRFGCFTYRQYSRYYHHLDTRLHVYTMHRIFPSFFGISPLLTFMYVSKFVWS